MRDIKFRAWDIVHNQMCYNANVLFWDEGGNLAGFEGLRPTGGAAVLIKGEFIAMQFTGLHDKNGKGVQEVYEGDIIDETGNIRGNVHENRPREVDLVIPKLGTKAWRSAYKEALGRGFDYAE